MKTKKPKITTSAEYQVTGIGNGRPTPEKYYGQAVGLGGKKSVRFLEVSDNRFYVNQLFPG
jgi:hypothetical protein